VFFAEYLAKGGDGEGAGPHQDNVERFLRHSVEYEGGMFGLFKGVLQQSVPSNCFQRSSGRMGGIGEV